MATTQALPLFPLHGVLLPGAALGLRVFEARYLDLVRECGRSGGSFGVCLILDGEEVGVPATPAAWGVEARIEDFDMGSDGVLQLKLRGLRRFQVLKTRVRDNGLVIGEVQWRLPDHDDELRPEHALLAILLEHILEHAGSTLACSGQAQIDPAAWVGWSLAALQPRAEEQRLLLLQEDDAHQRLDHLLAWIPDFEPPAEDDL